MLGTWSFTSSFHRLLLIASNNGFFFVVQRRSSSNASRSGWSRRQCQTSTVYKPHLFLQLQLVRYAVYRLNDSSGPGRLDRVSSVSVKIINRSSSGSFVTNKLTSALTCCLECKMSKTSKDHLQNLRYLHSTPQLATGVSNFRVTRLWRSNWQSLQEI